MCGLNNQQPATSNQQPAITFERVTKRFPAATYPAVDAVSLTVEKGSLVVLLGPSGCGKTTLLKMVNRLYEHDEGRILVDGREINSFKVTDLRRRIGYVIQSVGLFPHMTVARNIATVPEMLGWSRERINERIDELLDDQFLFRLNKVLGRRVVEVIEFRIAPEKFVVQKPVADKGTGRSIPIELISAAASIEDPGLRKAFLGAAVSCVNRLEEQDANQRS